MKTEHHAARTVEDIIGVELSSSVYRTLGSKNRTLRRVLQRASLVLSFVHIYTERQVVEIEHRATRTVRASLVLSFLHIYTERQVVEIEHRETRTVEGTTMC